MVNRKPSAVLIKLAKKYKVNITVKRGSKRLYKSKKLLKKQILAKMKINVRKIRKARKLRKARKTRKVRRNRFGSSGLDGPFENVIPGYGYNRPVVQKPGINGQSSEWVSSITSNMSRPKTFQLEDKYIPTLGTSKKFFNQDVPSVLPPRWQFMGQPDGTEFPLGYPFYRYKTTKVK